MIKNKITRSNIAGTDTHSAQLDGADTHAGQLNGSDGHSAGLSGTSSNSAGANGSVQRNGNTSASSQNVVQYILFEPSTEYLTINTTPPANSVAVLVLTGYVGGGGNAGSATLRRGTTNLVGVTLGGSAIYVDTNTGTSATSYNILNGVTQLALSHTQLTLQYITLTDTHAGVLNGSDTHSAGLSGSDTHSASLQGANNQFAVTKKQKSIMHG